LCGKQASEWGAIDCLFPHGQLQDIASHSKVVDKTIEWLQSEYKNVFEDGTGQMKFHRGKTHKYLGMSLDLSHPNQCRVTMIDYVNEIVVAYDKALKDMSDGFNIVTKKKNVARTSALLMICSLSTKTQRS
jgi:hypothetical protein